MAKHPRGALAGLCKLGGFKERRVYYLSGTQWISGDVWTCKDLPCYGILYCKELWPISLESGEQ